MAVITLGTKLTRAAHAPTNVASVGKSGGANFYPHMSAAVLVSRWINVKPILETCCGLDVHRDQVTACIASGPLDRAQEKLIVKEFSTMTYG